MSSFLLISPDVALDGNIPAMGPCPEVYFRYKPAMPEQVTEFLRVPRTSGKDEIKLIVDLLCKQLVSWDVKESDEKDAPTVPITPENLRRVPLRHLQRLVDLITGYGL